MSNNVYGLTWLADEDGTILGPPTQDTDHATNNVIAADRGIQAAFLRQGSHIRCILRQCIETLFCSFGVDALVSS